MFLKDNQGSGIYIIKCITKEIQKGSLGFGLGLDLLGCEKFIKLKIFKYKTNIDVSFLNSIEFLFG